MLWGSFVSLYFGYTLGSGYLPEAQRGRRGSGSPGSPSEGVGYLQVLQFSEVKNFSKMAGAPFFGGGADHLQVLASEETWLSRF